MKIPTSVILVVGLMITTCVIAYWSDNLGKKLGKKRISLFGLRPRQTATVISMVSSVGIMLVTLGALTVFSSQVRDAILRVDRLRDSNISLRTLNETLEATSTRLRTSVAAGKEQADRADKRARTAIALSDSITRGANVKVATAKLAISAAEYKLKAARKQLTSAQSGQASAVIGEKAARAQAALIRGQLARAQAQVRNAKAQLHSIDAKLVSADRGLQRLRALIRRNLENARADLVRYANLKQQLEHGNAEVLRLTQQRSELQSSVHGLDEQISKLTAVNAWLSSTATISTMLVLGTVVVDLGQALAEVVVPPNAETAQLRETLRRLLDAGSQAASKLGGLPYVNPDTGVTRTLHLASLPGPGGRIYNENQILDNFVSYLGTFSVPISVRLVSLRRYAKGETQFEARLVAIAVRRIYMRGDTLAEMTIDGSLGDAGVFNKLLALAERGGAAAREKGVNPLLSDKNAEFFAVGTNERIFEALRALQKIGKPARVKLVAAEDIFTVDNPSVRLVVERESADSVAATS
jgi:hypothetical protein